MTVLGYCLWNGRRHTSETAVHSPRGAPSASKASGYKQKCGAYQQGKQVTSAFGSFSPETTYLCSRVIVAAIALQEVATQHGLWQPAFIELGKRSRKDVCQVAPTCRQSP